MRKIYSLLLLGGLLLFGAQNVWAGSLSGGDVLYMQIPSYWFTANAKFSAYFYNSTTNSFADDFASKSFGDVYSVEVPEGTWTSIIVTRHSPSAASPSFESGDGFWSKSPDIAIGDGDYVYGFKYHDDNTSNATWTSYSLFSDYTVAFDNSISAWENVYVYTWKGSPAIETLGGWPAQKITPDANGICTISLKAQSGTKIIWHNNDGTQVEFTLEDDAVYNADGKIANLAKVSTKVTGKYYSTFYAPYNVEIPTKDDADNDITITAYTGEFDGTSTLTLHEISGSVIPGGQAVILKASTNADYSLIPTVKAAGAAGANSLAGKAASTAVSSMTAEIDGGTLCVLGVNGSNVGFYALNTTNTPNVAANKAYLIVPSTGGSAPSIHMVIEGEDNATDIQAIEANEAAVKFIENGKLLIRKDGVVYDMTGRVIR